MNTKINLLKSLLSRAGLIILAMASLTIVGCDDGGSSDKRRTYYYYDQYTGQCMNSRTRQPVNYNDQYRCQNSNFYMMNGRCYDGTTNRMLPVEDSFVCGGQSQGNWGNQSNYYLDPTTRQCIDRMSGQITNSMYCNNSGSQWQNGNQWSNGGQWQNGNQMLYRDSFGNCIDNWGNHYPPNQCY